MNHRANPVAPSRRNRGATSGAPVSFSSTVLHPPDPSQCLTSGPIRHHTKAPRSADTSRQGGHEDQHQPHKNRTHREQTTRSERRAMHGRIGTQDIGSRNERYWRNQSFPDPPPRLKRQHPIVALVALDSAEGAGSRMGDHRGRPGSERDEETTSTKFERSVAPRN